VQGFNVQFKSGLNQLSLSHESNKKDEKRKTKQKNYEQLSMEIVIKIRKNEGDWWEGFMEKVSFESGVELR